MLLAFIHALCTGLQNYTKILHVETQGIRQRKGRCLKERREEKIHVKLIERVSCAAVAIYHLANQAAACRTQEIYVEGKSTEPLFSFAPYTADGWKCCIWFRKVKAVVLKTKQ